MDPSIIKTGMTLGWSMLDDDARAYLEMEKISATGHTRFQWPQPGGKLVIELEARGDHRDRFFLDIGECRRTATIAVGLLPERKSKMQTRAADRPLIRIDYASDPDMLMHMNPDGKVIVGSHMHIDVDDPNRMSWAFPLDRQTILSPNADIGSVAGIFFAFMDACHIDKSISVEQLLGV